MQTAAKPPRRDVGLLRSFAARIDRTDAGGHNNLGVLYHTAGLHEEAVAAFARALELDPAMQVAQRNLEVASLASGVMDRRAAELRARLRARPGDRDTRWTLGRTCALLGDHAEAIEHFGVLAAADDAAALIQLAQSHRALDDVESACAALERARCADPGSSLVHFHLAEIEYHRGLNQRALEHLETAVRLNAGNHDAWHLLSFVLGDEGRHEEAARAAERAHALNPELARAEPNLAVTGAATARYVDMARRDANRRVEVAAAGDSPLVQLTLAVAFRTRGYHAEALRAYEQALERGEARSLALRGMAEVHLLRRDAANALGVLDILLAEQPGDARLWTQRGVALHLDGQTADALACYERAIAIDEGCADALSNAGVARYQLGEAAVARECFARALCADPAHRRARLNEALAHHQAGNYVGAITSYREALTRDASDAVAWNGTGLALRELGRNSEARTAFARAIEAQPGMAAAHYNLSFTLSALGDVAGAMRENQAALELDPYYTPPGFELALDLLFEDDAMTLAAGAAAVSRVDEAVDQFAVAAGEIEALFSDLLGGSSPAEPAATAPVADPYAMALELLSKGLPERAHAEAMRVVSRGGDRLRGSVVLGDIFARQRLWGEALERYAEVLAHAPGHREARRGAGGALLHLDRIPEARAIAESLVADGPSDVEALLLLADARDRADERDGAADALRRARALAPSRHDVPARLGHLARRSGRIGEALASFREALSLDPGSAELRLAIGQCLLQRSDMGGAERELRALLDAHPRFGPAVLELGGVLRACGRAADAVPLLADLLQHDVYHFDALVLLGETLLDLGRAADALVGRQRVLGFQPTHADALCGAGAALAALHRLRDAESCWKRVVELDSSGPAGLRARRELRALHDRRRRLDATGTEGRWR